MLVLECFNAYVNDREHTLLTTNTLLIVEVEFIHNGTNLCTHASIVV